MFKRSFVAALAVLATGPAWAEITIEDAYFRTATPMSKTGAAFMILNNSGPEADRLVAARSDIAVRVELHTHIDMGEGVMQMTEVEDGFPIPPGTSHALVRGGDHVMFMGLTQAVPDDGTVSVTLVFEVAGEIVVEIQVDRARDHP